MPEANKNYVQYTKNTLIKYKAVFDFVSLNLSQVLTALGIPIASISRCCSYIGSTLIRFLLIRLN